MSEVTNRQTIIDADTARFAAEYGEIEDRGEPDTQKSIPEKPMESEAGDDGALAVSETDELESDTEDGIPDEGEEEVTDYEQRFKDTQASLTEKSQELSQLRQEQSEAMAEITSIRFDLTDRMNEAEQVASFWANQAQADVQRLQQVNPQQLTQEQYGQWQQQMAAVQHRANQLNQALAQTQQQSKKARDEAMNREAAIARASLERTIDGFQEVYPEIGKYAIEQGVNPRVWRDITDPALVRILHRAMQAEAQPDTVETLTKKTLTKKHQTRNAKVRDERGRFKAANKAIQQARTPQERKHAYTARDRMRLEREYGR